MKRILLVIMAMASMTWTYVHAQESLRLIVPYAAGGTQDLVARTLQQTLGQKLGMTVVVENVAGAGGTIGMSRLALSAPDGRTVALITSNHFSSAFIYKNLKYDPLESFTPISLIGKTGFALMVSREVPAQSVPEFIDYAKRHPGKLNYASAGIGSNTHMGMALFAARAGIDIVHVPFKGTGDAVIDVLAGRSHAVLPGTIGVLPHLEDERVKILGLSSQVGQKGKMQAIPTIASAGLPDYEYDAWYGLVAPANMEAATVERINEAMNAALRDISVVTALERAAIVPMPESVEEFTRIFKAEYGITREIVELAGVDSANQ